MKHLFLTSGVHAVAHDLPRHFDTPANDFSLVFIDTPAKVEEGDKQWLQDDRAALVKAGFQVFDYDISGKTLANFDKDLNRADIIYVSGGNTFYMLQESQKTGFVDYVRQRVNSGTPYIGTSAGSIIAGPDIYPTHTIDNVGKAPDLKGYEGYGLIDVVIFPHWGSDYFKKLYLESRLEHVYSHGNKYILLNDQQYLHVKDDWYQIVEVKHD